MSVLSHLELAWVLAWSLNGLALILWVIRGLLQDHRNGRLTRLALDIVAKILEKIPQDQVSEKATEPLRALAEFVEAQHAKPHLPRLPRTPTAPP